MKRRRKRNFISRARTWWRSGMLWFSWSKASSGSWRLFNSRTDHRALATACRWPTIPSSPSLYTTLHCTHIWAVCMFVFSPQIFCKLLYFEPVVGELNFAALQWVFLFLSMSCSRMYQGQDRADNSLFSAQRYLQAEECSWDGFLRPATALLTKTWGPERSKIHGSWLSENRNCRRLLQEKSGWTWGVGDIYSLICS